MVEEGNPQVDVLPFRSLVGDIAHERVLLFASEFCQVSEDEFLGDAGAALAFADVDKELVECLVVERMINQSGDGLGGGLETDAGGREPLPVAVVAQHGGAVASLVQIGFHLLDVAELEVFAQFLLADGEQLEGLVEIVAEEMIEVALDVTQFALAFIGE